MIENKIVLEVVYHTEESSKKEDQGLTHLLSKEDYTLKKVYFYKIDALCPYEDEILGSCARVIVGCESFTVPQDIDKTESLIQSQLDGFKPE